MDVVIVTANGMVKRTTPTSSGHRPGRWGITAMGVGAGDQVVGAVALRNEQNVMWWTAGGTAIKFASSDLRTMGRVHRAFAASG